MAGVSMVAMVAIDILVNHGKFRLIPEDPLVRITRDRGRRSDLLRHSRATHLLSTVRQSGHRRDEREGEALHGRCRGACACGGVRAGRVPSARASEWARRRDGQPRCCDCTALPERCVGKAAPRPPAEESAGTSSVDEPPRAG
jgi:hypothetical protein